MEIISWRNISKGNSTTAVSLTVDNNKAVYEKCVIVEARILTLMKKGL
jgi:hypothetical protein